MDILIEILVVLLLARILGEVAEKLGQTASVGELLAGVLLAGMASLYAAQLPWLGQVTESETIAQVAEVGIFFLVLQAGLELEPGEIAQQSKAALLVALGGVAVPLAGGVALAWAFLPESDQKTVQALLVGLAMSISAIPATVKIFTDFNLLHQKIGRTVIGAALFDDVIGFILLAVLLSLIDSGELPGPGTLAAMILKVAAFFAITGLIGAHVYPRVRKGIKLLQASAMEFSALLLAALAYGLLAELLGVHWVLGAFMAGLYFEASRVGAKAYSAMKVTLTAITGGVLGPLFFAFIGLQVDLTALTAVPLFTLLLIAVAIGGKVAGAGLPARLMGMSRRDSLAVGSGLSARGAIEMVILSIALERGVFDPPSGADGIVAHLFSALVIMAVATTLLTPLMLRRLLR